MAKEVFCYIPKGAKIYAHQIGKTGWKKVFAGKDNSFCQDQIKAAAQVVFPVPNYIVFRFHNFFCAVEKKNVTEKSF